MTVSTAVSKALWMRVAKLAAASLLFGAGCLAQAESLYQENGYRSMVSDVKAYRPGDSLTVLIVENATAQSTTDTSSSRNQNLGFDVQDTLHTPRTANVKSNNEFDNTGATQRTGKLLASISVTVQSVTPNGELVVAGEQLLKINNEMQHIKLQGRVRPYDISSNSVPSTRLADAKISYVGDGDLSDRQRPSWWMRFLTWIGF
jgi:flagellar L-ring protein precursor FlgH